VIAQFKGKASVGSLLDIEFDDQMDVFGRPKPTTRPHEKNAKIVCGFLPALYINRNMSRCRVYKSQDYSLPWFARATNLSRVTT
jgi:hypothetical protein